MDGYNTGFKYSSLHDHFVEQNEKELRSEEQDGLVYNQLVYVIGRYGSTGRLIKYFKEPKGAYVLNFECRQTIMFNQIQWVRVKNGDVTLDGFGTYERKFIFKDKESAEKALKEHRKIRAMYKQQTRKQRWKDYYIRKAKEAAAALEEYTKTVDFKDLEKAMKKW